ncbi:MAG: hypothetical protein KGV46_03730 [Pasteurella sp.]|nr:hypothetical protein [Pasteurella sp.]
MEKHQFTDIEQEILTDFNSLIKNNNNITDGNVTVYFRDLKKHLLTHIDEYPIILGALAWMPNYDILATLVDKQCQLVIQKEGFLYSDREEKLSPLSLKMIKNVYAQLHFDFQTKHFSSHIYELTFDEIFSLEPIKCLGAYNKKLQHITPKMHHKFFIFADFNAITNKIVPKAVWTGCVDTAWMPTNSLDSVIFIKSNVIATSYLKEYENIYYLSESIDMNWITV